ncbi:hypothetical protein [Marinobacterium lutimaris]|uniref:Uncharacterized protein n=1 Tax=Marinobacterium lutimaris TaxID=568106 RepID=A0A1H5UF49_9GAMM|nr:hypothetical protein [Marinobacterium lutimaris]SEF73609.1 hypothetical protein SAMN05444390_101361 [Marinobacterium lutimaris]
MSRASIFDRLHQRLPEPEPEPTLDQTRTDYDPDRLRLIDGVALTSAGFVGNGDIPEPAGASLSESLHGADGYRLLVHEISDLPPLSDLRLKRLEARAVRLQQLLQAIVIDALMLLESVPEDSRFDVILTAPVRSPEATDILTRYLQDLFAETAFGERLGELRVTRKADDPHRLLGVTEEGGMPYVLWICADSLLNPEALAAPDIRTLLSQASRGAGVYPGEAVVALLAQRVLPQQKCFEEGWLLGKGVTHEHSARASLRNNQRRKELIELLQSVWVNAEEGDEPARMVIDAFALPGRAIELGGAVIECWPGVDALEDAVALDVSCGWTGEAIPALMLVMAMTGLGADQEAVIMSLSAETSSEAWVLRSFHRRAAQTEALSEAHTKENHS